MAEQGYFLVLDVLGFSATVQNSSEAMIKDRIQQWVSAVTSSKDQSGVQRCQLFSDTVFAAVPSSEDGLKSLTTFARNLLAFGLENSFMVRGGIAHGQFTSGELTYGPAVIAAHALEARQNWIGVSCEGGLPHIAGLWRVDEVVCYLPPMKSGRIQAHPAVAWNVPDAGRLTELVLKGNSVRDGDFLTWDVAEKLSNTLLFRSYLRVLKEEGLDPSKFHGPLPSQVIDEVISKRAYPGAG